jgi:hypothetical protein
MKNYRRLSGDGSVKVVLRGDSNSPPKTTSRREPLPYNSAPTQELRTGPCFHPGAPLHAAFQPLFAQLSPVPFVILPPVRQRSFHPGRSAIIEKYRLSFCHPNKEIDTLAVALKRFSRTETENASIKHLRRISLKQSKFAETTHSIAPDFEFPTRHLSCKKARESAIVHVSLRPLPAQKVDFLARPLLGYWLLAIGYSSVQPATADPGNRVNYPRNSHLISSKSPAIPEFLSNPTCPSQQNVDCLGLAHSDLLTRYFSFKKARKSAKVHVSLRPLRPQKVDFLASPLLGYWLLAIGYFSVPPATAYPANHPGTSHLISSQTRGIPEFSPNSTAHPSKM